MTDRTKFEKMLELLINEDRDAAEELFHEIVVEKSRDIYEGLLEADLEDEDEIEEASEEDDEDEIEESTDEELDEFAVEADPMGGDPADDMIGDIEMGDGDDEGDDMDMDDDGEEAGDDEVEDRIEDLEDALDELKAEFEAMMGGTDGDEGDMDMDMGGEEGEEEEAEEEAFNFESADADGKQLDEYTNKVADPKGEDNKAKSPVAGKNDMGGTAANIAKGSADEKGGSADKPKVDDAGNVNTKGGNKKAPAYKSAKA
jgi:acidic leucine-rich nuclear phosphoprotein 32 family protein B